MNSQRLYYYDHLFFRYMYIGTFPYKIPQISLPAGSHVFTIYQRTTEFLGGSQFFLPRGFKHCIVCVHRLFVFFPVELEVYFVNDTPTLNVDTVHAEFRSNRPGASLEVQCHLTHFDFYKTNCMAA